MIQLALANSAGSGVVVSAVVQRRNGKRVVVLRGKTKATRQKNSEKSSYRRPNLPEKPKVTVGAHCYGKTKKGGYIVSRFSITQWRPGRYADKPKSSDPWFVLDLEEDKHYFALGTNPHGYRDKEEALQVAREYRDEYGAYSVMPF